MDALLAKVKEGTPLSQLKDVYRNRYREEFEIKRWGFSKVCLNARFDFYEKNSGFE